jgi:ribosomal protein S28E/S33
MKLDPLTNATVIGDVIKFIETEREKDDVQRPKI